MIVGKGVSGFDRVKIEVRSIGKVQVLKKGVSDG